MSAENIELKKKKAFHCFKNTLKSIHVYKA